MIELKRRMANIEIDLETKHGNKLSVQDIITADTASGYVGSMAVKINQYLGLSGSNEHVGTCNIIREELENRRPSIT